MKPRFSLLKPLHNLSIRLKLVVVFSILIATISLYLYFLIPAWFEDLAMNVIAAKARYLSETTAFNVSSSLHFRDESGVQTVLEVTGQNTDVVYIVVQGRHANTQTAYNYERAREEDYLNTGPSSNVFGHSYIYKVKSPVLHNGRRIGDLYLGLSLLEIEDDIQRTRQAMTLISITIFFVGVVAVYAFSTALTQPLDEMVKIVHRITRGDLTPRAPVVYQDEVGYLAESFNLMVDGLQQAQKDLEAANRELEARVAERTKELTQEIRERTQAEKDLEYRVESGNLISAISTQFISMEPDQIDGGIQYALEIIGHFLDVDRASVFQLSEDKKMISKTHEWCAESIPSNIDRLQKIRIADFPLVGRKMKNLEVIQIGHVDELPEDETLLRQFYAQEGVLSLMFVPMEYGRQLLGYLGLVMVREPRTWNHEMVRMLRIIGEIFVSALERKRTDEFLRSLLSAIETIQVGVTITNNNGQIIYCNPAEAHMHGYTVDELIGQDARIFAPRHRWHDMAIDDIIKLKDRKRESVNIHKDGTLFPVNLTSNYFTSSSGQPIGTVTICEDITEMKAFQQELINYQQKLSFLIDQTPLVFIEWNRDWEIIQWNPAAEKLFGFSREEMENRLGLDQIVPEEEADTVQVVILELSRGRTSTHSVTRNRTKDGQNIICEWYNTPILDKDGDPIGFISLALDITRRVETEAKLKESRETFRNLSLHLQTVREEERTKIAREIHDELGQTMTAFKIDLFWLSTHLTNQENSIHTKIDDMSRRIEATIKTVQRISSELRPAMLDNLDLTAAIEWQTREFQERTGLICDLTLIPHEFQIGKELATVIFRIFQETLTNIARHANATQVDIRFVKKTKWIILRVEDDGQGITSEQIKDRHSLGLIGIRERVKPWDGSVRFRGHAQKGTSVTVRIPLTQEGDDDDPHFDRG